MRGHTCFLLAVFLVASISNAELSPAAFRDATITHLQHQVASLPATKTLSECVDPLECWLEELTFQIPDTCFEVLHVECCITEFICQGIALGNIDSEYTYPTSLYMALEELGTSCAGNWKYGVLGGTLTADMSEIDVSTTAEFPKEDIYATAMMFPTCDIPSIKIELSFSGGLVGAVLDLISGAVESGLEKAVYTIICEKAEGAIATKVTDALVNTINPAVADIVASVPSLPLPSEEIPTDTYLDYTTSLPGTLEELETRLGDDYLNKLVDHFTDGTGEITLDLQDLTVEKEIIDPTSGPLANLTLIFHELQLGGLNSFHDIYVLTPSPDTSPVYSPYSVAASISANTITAVLDMTVDVELDQLAVGGSSLVERFAVELDLSDLTLGGELFLPLNLQRLGELYLDQITDINCLLSSMDYMWVSSLVAELKVDMVSITPIGEDVDPESLESDIDKLINDILLVGISGFPELVTGVIKGLAQGQIREGINAQLSLVLEQATSTCNPHQVLPPDTPPSYVDWSESGVVSLLDKVINDAIGFEGVNKLVDGLTDDTGKVVIDLASVVLELFNLDSFYELALLTPSPTNSFDLNSEVGAGYCKGHGSGLHKEPCFPLGLSLTPQDASPTSVAVRQWAVQSLTSHFIGSLDEQIGDVGIELLFSNATAFLSATTKLDMNNLAALQVKQLSSFAGDVTARNGCLLGALDEVAVHTLSLAVAEASLQKGVVQKDIAEPVQKILDMLGSDNVLGAINTMLQAVLDTSKEACESGEWPPPLPDDDDDDDNSPVCDSPLSCWLNHMVIGPSEEMCLDISGVSVCFDALQCYNMDLEGFPTSLVDPRTLSLGLTDLDMTCSGDYALRLEGGNELYAGSAKIKLTDFSSSVNVELEGSATTSQYPSYPDGIDLDSCAIQPGYLVEVTFKGGALGSILNKAIAPVIENFLMEDLNWLLCYVIAPPLSRVLTKVITTKLDPVLMDVMDLGTEIIAPVQESGMVSWNTSVLEMVYDLLDSLRNQPHEGSGFGDMVSCMMDGSSDQGLAVSTDDILELFTQNSRSGSASVRDLKFPGLTVDINEIIPLSLKSGTTGTITIETLTISGLKTIHDLMLFKPSSTSSVTLTSGLSLSELDLQLAVVVDLDDTADTGNADGFGVYQQELIIDLALGDSTLQMDLVLAMQEAVLGALYVDQALDLGCLMSSVADFRFSSISLDLIVDNLSVQQVRRGDAGVLEKDATALIDNAVAVLVEGYSEMLSAVLKGVFQGPVKDGVNAAMMDAAQSWVVDHPCSAHIDHHANTTSPVPVIWAENPLIIGLDKVLNELIGPSGLNKIFNCATNATGEILIHIPSTSPILADWTIGLEGLSSFYEFALLYPVAYEEYDLGNVLGLGYCADPSDASNYNPITDPFNHGSSCSPFALVISGDESYGRHVDIAITLENMYLYLDLLLELNKKALADLQLSQLSQDGCLMSTMSEMGVHDLLLSASEVEFYFNNGAGEVDLTSLITGLLDSLSSPETLASINSQLADALVTATQKCDGTYEPFDNGGTSSSSSDTGLSDWKWQLGLVLGCCVVAVCVLLWIYNHYGTMTSKRNYDGESFEYESNGDANSVSMYDSGAFFSNEWITEKIAILFGWTEGDFHYDALLGQERIPAYVRILMPFALVGNIVLFLNANLVTGASVMAEVDLGNTVIKPDPVFEFGLANTVSDMWEAEVYPLSILVAFFSGAWPYIKLAAMFVCWVLPTSGLPLVYRDAVLRWLDILGKWSLLDTYVMVMMMVAFNFNLVVAPGIEVIVYVVPNWGFYGFLLATMMSLGLGHLVLACHRLVSEPKVPSDVDATEAVMDHTFSVEISQKSVELSSFSTDETMSSEGHKTGGRVWKVRQVAFTFFGKFFIVFMLAASILAMIVGTFMNTFQFEFKGLTGYLMDPDDRVMPYGLVSIGDILPSASGSPKDFGIRWIQASYFAFGLGMPLAFLVALLLLWVTPLTLRMQKFCVVMTEVLNAWNALDVFVISIVAALMEIQQFASFIVGDSCDLINEVLKENMDTELEGDDKCFDVVATLKETAVYLYLSAFMLVVVGIMMLRMYLCAVHERVESFQHQQLADKFACLSQDGRDSEGEVKKRGEHRPSETSETSMDMSSRTTFNTQNYTSLSGTIASETSYVRDVENSHENRTRVETVDLTLDDEAAALTGQLSGEVEQYQPPSYSRSGNSAYDKEIDHAASVLTNKSKSSSSTRPTTLAQVLSGDSSEGDCAADRVEEQRGRGTQLMSFSIKTARFLGLVTISTDDEEDE